ncbi:hypothetical protein GOP47_0019726 [Adiantum capillus-veneris]|uniref:Uncharacterized protein n=1 Tax=Adiantum capillus-veneris TaxID=13818 RepID=A0A9D4UBM5_ADICA|nr:hypothetical protein GOP47_0019726 [Adiantum capillus-veneris]
MCHLVSWIAPYWQFAAHLTTPDNQGTCKGRFMQLDLVRLNSTSPCSSKTIQKTNAFHLVKHNHGNYFWIKAFLSDHGEDQSLHKCFASKASPLCQQLRFCERTPKAAVFTRPGRDFDISDIDF